jgi:hypothetical protein
VHFPPSPPPPSPPLTPHSLLPRSFTQACTCVLSLTDPAPLLSAAARALSHSQERHTAAIDAAAAAAAAADAAAAAAATISKLQSQVEALQLAVSAAENKCAAAEAKAAAQQSAAADQVAQATAKAQSLKVRGGAALPLCVAVTSRHVFDILLQEEVEAYEKEFVALTNQVTFPPALSPS